MKRVLKQTADYIVFADGASESIMCRACGRESFNPNDVQQLYCGCCHTFHEHTAFARQIEQIKKLRIPGD